MIYGLLHLRYASSKVCEYLKASYNGNSFGTLTLLTATESLLRYLFAYWNVGVEKHDL